MVFAFLGAEPVKEGCDAAPDDLLAAPGGLSQKMFERGKFEGMNAIGPSECPNVFDWVEVW